MTSARHGFYLVVSCLGLALGLWGIHSQWTLAGLPRGFDARSLAYPVIVGAAHVGSPDQLRFEVQARPIGSTVEIERSRGSTTIRLRRQMSPIEFTTSLIAGLFFFAVNLFVFLGRIDRTPARDFYWATLFFGLAVMIGGVSPPRRDRSSRSALPIVWMVSLAVLPVFFIHMTLTFPRRRPFIDRARWFMPAVTATAVVVVLWQASTFVHYASVRDFAAWQVTRPPWVLAQVFLVGMVGAGCLVLLDSSRRLELTRERESTKWLLWGFTIGITPYVFLRTLPRIFGLGDADRHRVRSDPRARDPDLLHLRRRPLSIPRHRHHHPPQHHLHRSRGHHGSGLHLPRGSRRPRRAPLHPGRRADDPVRGRHRPGRPLSDPTRRAIGGWVDRTFFKIDYDHAQALRSLKERSPSVSSPLEMAGLVRSLLDESLQPKDDRGSRPGGVGIPRRRRDRSGPRPRGDRSSRSRCSAMRAGRSSRRTPRASPRSRTRTSPRSSATRGCGSSFRSRSRGGPLDGSFWANAATSDATSSRTWNSSGASRRRRRSRWRGSVWCSRSPRRRSRGSVSTRSTA